MTRPITTEAQKPPSRLPRRVRDFALGATAMGLAMGLGGCGQQEPEPLPFLYDTEAEPRARPVILDEDEILHDAPCAPLYGPGPDAHANNIVQKISARFQHSRTGAWLWQQAPLLNGEPVWVCLNAEDRKEGEYQPGINTVTLQDDGNIDEMTNTLVHELRHADQTVRGYFSEKAHLGGSNFMNTVFAKEADAEAISTLAAWEMKENGVTGPWRRKIDDSFCTRSRNDCYAPISLRFAAAVAADKNAIQNGDALRAAFREWYNDVSITATYRMFNGENPGPVNTGVPRGSVRHYDIPGNDFKRTISGMTAVPTYGIDYLAPPNDIRAVLSRPGITLPGLK